MPTGVYQRSKRKRYRIQEDGCWIWKQAESSGMYGKCRFGEGGLSQTTAHRVMYQEAKGEIPDDLVLDHLCKNIACVNPDHLEVVTQQVNVQRSDSAKLNPDKVRFIRRLKQETDATSKEIAGLLGVSRSLIDMVSRGAIWNNIK